MFATTDVYNFWLYELCDVYIVRTSLIKPLQKLNIRTGSHETYDR